MTPEAAQRELGIRSTAQQCATLSAEFLRLRALADMHAMLSETASGLVGAIHQNGKPHLSPKEQHAVVSNQLSSQADAALGTFFQCADHLHGFFAPKEPGLRITPGDS